MTMNFLRSFFRDLKVKIIFSNRTHVFARFVIMWSSTICDNMTTPLNDQHGKLCMFEVNRKVKHSCFSIFIKVVFVFERLIKKNFVKLEIFVYVKDLVCKLMKLLFWLQWHTIHISVLDKCRKFSGIFKTSISKYCSFTISLHQELHGNDCINRI